MTFLMIALSHHQAFWVLSSTTIELVLSIDSKASLQLCFPKILGPEAKSWPNKCSSVLASLVIVLLILTIFRVFKEKFSSPFLENFLKILRFFLHFFALLGNYNLGNVLSAGYEQLCSCFRKTIISSLFHHSKISKTCINSALNNAYIYKKNFVKGNHWI